MSSETIDLIRALAAPLAVLVPLLVFWIQKRDRLQKAKHFIEMLKAHDDLKAVQEKHRSDPLPDNVAAQVRHLIAEMEIEISRSSEKLSVSPFIVIVAAGTLLISLVFTQLSDYINKLFLGKSYESGMLFLEGIFQSSTSRFLLLMVYVSVSLFITMKMVKPVTGKLATAFKRNLAMLLVFNVIFVAVTILVSLVLILLDPIVDLW